MRKHLPTQAARPGCPTAEPSDEELVAAARRDRQAFSPLFGPDVKERVTAPASVQARKTPQSTNPDAVRARLAALRAWLAHR